MSTRLLVGVERHWLWGVAAIWLLLAGWFLLTHLGSIRSFSLIDTDDNMRLMQVRGLLHGQGWFDLRQYRLNPPFGANIHWSRLVDLPIAGLILLLRPFVGGAAAEMWGVAIAPLIPLSLLVFSLALLARRLIDPIAYALPAIALFFSASASSMFMPDRIDHHGWQLALLVLGMAGIADPQRKRGGLVLGAATALSLAIGLELLIYLALLGVAVVLFWVIDEREKERLRFYALSVGGGTALAFLVFASNDNRLPVCDALSPVWLSDALLGGALLFVLASLRPANWKNRLLLAVAAGAAIAAFHAISWPHCLHRLEGVSPEADRLWLSHVREARPVYLHGWRVALQYLAMAFTGMAGWLLLAWRNRGDADLLRRTLAASAPAIASALLLFWQTRTGPAAQATATVGVAALGFILVPWAWNSRYKWVSIAGTIVAAILGTGALGSFILGLVPDHSENQHDKDIRRGTQLCWSMWGMHQIAGLPAGRIMTYVDLGPRIIALTHHDAVTGPYHRNYEQIVDVAHFWRGDADQAHAIARKYRSNYVLSCPMSSTSTIFEAEAPKGFYMQLQKGEVPAWLTPVPLPKDSPFKMWRVVG